MAGKVVNSGFVVLSKFVPKRREADTGTAGRKSWNYKILHFKNREQH